MRICAYYPLSMAFGFEHHLVFGRRHLYMEGVPVVYSSAPSENSSMPSREDMTGRIRAFACVYQAVRKVDPSKWIPVQTEMTNRGVDVAGLKNQYNTNPAGYSGTHDISEVSHEVWYVGRLAALSCGISIVFA